MDVMQLSWPRNPAERCEFREGRSYATSAMWCPNGSLMLIPHVEVVLTGVMGRAVVAWWRRDFDEVRSE